MADMTITYVDGLMVVTHPTGIINKYDIKHLSKHREFLENQQNELDLSIVDIDKHIANCQSSINP